MNIIGFGYKSGVGKDTLADHLCRRSNVFKMSMATPLKALAHELYGYLGVREASYYEGSHKKERRQETYGPHNWNIVQIWVHMNVLCAVDPGLWVHKTTELMKAKEKENGRPCIFTIPDIRKEVEIQAVKAAGGITVWIDREVPDKAEAEIDKLLMGKEHLFDHRIDGNPGIPEAYAQADLIFEKHIAV